MINYYELLGVAANASEAEIRQKLKDKKRIWTQRQNAPRRDQQQEASNNLSMIPAIEEALLNPAKRAAYDQKLRAQPKGHTQVNQASHQNMKAAQLMEEARRLLSLGDALGALSVAKKVTAANPEDADAWALSAHCRFQGGETESAIYEYKRAIELRPGDASFRFDLGSVYEEIENWPQALAQYQQAVRIDSKQTAYRAAMGAVHIKQDNFSEGVKLLEQCLREEPDNEGYKYLLAIGYTAGAHEQWTEVREGGPVPAGWYATELRQVQAAEEILSKVEGLNSKDPVLLKTLEALRDDVARMKARRFHGSKFAAGAYLVIGMMSVSSAPLAGLGVIAMGILYVMSCRTQQYKLNARIIGGGGATAGHFLGNLARNAGGGNLWVDGRGYVYKDNSGLWALLFGVAFILVSLPFVTLFNCLKNYILVDHPISGDAVAGYAMAGGVLLAAAAFLPAAPGEGPKRAVPQTRVSDNTPAPKPEPQRKPEQRRPEPQNNSLQPLPWEPRQTPPKNEKPQAAPSQPGEPSGAASVQTASLGIHGVGVEARDGRTIRLHIAKQKEPTFIRLAGVELVNDGKAADFLTQRIRGNKVSCEPVASGEHRCTLQEKGQDLSDELIKARLARPSRSGPR